MEKQCWFKFEGPQNKTQMANLHKVMLDGKEIAVLNFKRNPSIKENDTFFMVEGIEDSRGKPIQVITGRGTLCAANPKNICPEEWCKIKGYEWMSGRPIYVVIKDFEMLDAPISKCFNLDTLLFHLQDDLYMSSAGEDRSMKALKRIHTQKPSVRITPKAEEYINNKFDEFVARLGSVKFVSEL